MSELPLVGLIMGSTSDWDTMSHAAAELERFGVPYENAELYAHLSQQSMDENARDEQ